LLPVLLLKRAVEDVNLVVGFGAANNEEAKGLELFAVLLVLLSAFWPKRDLEVDNLVSKENNEGFGPVDNEEQKGLLGFDSLVADLLFKVLKQHVEDA